MDVCSFEVVKDEWSLVFLLFSPPLILPMIAVVLVGERNAVAVLLMLLKMIAVVIMKQTKATL